MTEKIYSTLGCGCYYTGESSPWVVCKRHAGDKGIPLAEHSKDTITYESLIKQRIQNTYIAKNSNLPDDNIRSGCPVYENDIETTRTKKRRHSQRTVYPTGKYDLSRVTTDRILPIPKSATLSSQTKARRFWLYVLKLAKDKYYIGITAKQNPLYRIDNHGTLLGARWTFKYPPTEILEIVDLGKVTKEQAERMENEVTLIYMEKYGRSNVRGGYMATPGWLYFTATKPTSRRPLTIGAFLQVIAIVVLAVYLFGIAILAYGLSS